MITTTSRVKKTVTKTITMRADGLTQIPFAIAKKYGLQEGDTLTLRDLGRGFIVILPQKAKHSKDSGSDELAQVIWDRMEEEASEAILRGDVSPQFETADDLIAYLHQQKA